MNVKNKKALSYLIIGIIVATILSFSVLVTASFLKTPEKHLPSAASTIEYIVMEQTKPVIEDIVILNNLREEAGLRQVNEDWKIVNTGMFILDGPSVTVLLDEESTPAKVIMDENVSWLGINRIREYEVINGKLNGKAVTWVGKPEKLLMLETYKDNELHGPTIYYSETGQEICRCEFKNDKPWTGREFSGYGFTNIGLEQSYKNGKLDGEMKQFTPEGQLCILRTYKNGRLHGPDRSYSYGQPSGEVWFWKGKVIGLNDSGREKFGNLTNRR
ncbi:MAG: hypothetical protein JW787_01545 [Sedimentisphaerales bacterium]|nr:hypothetical protein [Sedimentisphaerales bacterium]